MQLDCNLSYSEFLLERLLDCYCSAMGMLLNYIGLY